MHGEVPSLFHAWFFQALYREFLCATASYKKAGSLLKSVFQHTIILNGNGISSSYIKGLIPLYTLRHPVDLILFRGIKASGIFK